MGLYNMLFGTTPATVLILPMLGTTPDDYPRFRDCFIIDEEHPEYDNHIIVYTRTGGGNREEYHFDNEVIRGREGFVTDYDGSFDYTYASWVFEVPVKWKADYDKIKEGNIKDISIEYQKELRRIYPKLDNQWDELFKSNEKDIVK